MKYELKNFEGLLGLAGFSDTLLKNHFTLYQGYVMNTNKIADILASFAREGKTGTPEYAELKRRFGWEFNGMRLHEYYFDNMAKEAKGVNHNSNLIKKVEADFGSYDSWEKDFKATGAMRGIGWVLLAHDTETDQLFNIWINEHDIGHLAGAKPILVMDVFEHAYMIDYGLKKVDYIDAFFPVISWRVCEERLNK